MPKYPECECVFCYADEVERLEALIAKIPSKSHAFMPEELWKQIKDVNDRSSPPREFN